MGKNQTGEKQEIIVINISIKNCEKGTRRKHDKEERKWEITNAKEIRKELVIIKKKMGHRCKWLSEFLERRQRKNIVNGWW